MPILTVRTDPRLAGHSRNERGCYASVVSGRVTARQATFLWVGGRRRVTKVIEQALNSESTRSASALGRTLCYPLTSMRVGGPFRRKGLRQSASLRSAWRQGDTRLLRPAHTLAQPIGGRATDCAGLRTGQWRQRGRRSFSRSCILRPISRRRGRRLACTTCLMHSIQPRPRTHQMNQGSTRVR